MYYSTIKITEDMWISIKCHLKSDILVNGVKKLHKNLEQKKNVQLKVYLECLAGTLKFKVRMLTIAGGFKEREMQKA